jgi:hypothetical protein
MTHDSARTKGDGFPAADAPHNRGTTPLLLELLKLSRLLLRGSPGAAGCSISVGKRAFQEVV